MILMVGMNDVLPKPFTKDSLLGMLEKHLLHMKQMQQMQQGYAIPVPMKAQRLVELPEDQQQSPSTSQQAAPPPTLTDSLNLEDPNLAFSYDQNYNAIFGATPNAPPQSPYPPQSPTTANGKRRTTNDHDPYEYIDQTRSMPRSTGAPESQVSGKRARYGTPPW